MRNDPQNHPVGKKLLVRDSGFAYLCPECQDRIRVAHFFRKEDIDKDLATSERACCYHCYRGLDGSEENYSAYQVGTTPDGQILPSAFALLEVGLACEALEQEPTVARVLRQLREDGMIWSKEVIQAALHAMFPESIAPAFIERQEGQ